MREARPATDAEAPVMISADPSTFMFKFPESVRLPTAAFPKVETFRLTPVPVTVRSPVLLRVVTPVEVKPTFRLPKALSEISTPVAVTKPPN